LSKSKGGGGPKRIYNVVHEEVKRNLKKTHCMQKEERERELDAVGRGGGVAASSSDLYV